MTVTRCDTALACAGHLGKFSTCRDEAVWQSTMDGGGQSTGTVEFEGHLTMIKFDADELIDLNGVSVLVDAGTYLVLDDDLGFVYVTVHSADEAQRIFDEFEDRYCDWDETVN